MQNLNAFCKGMLLVCAALWQCSPLTALDYYWVGGSGLWSDHNNHWATSSGGNVFHDQVPQSMDNVYFDANSFPSGGTVTIDPTIIYCLNMDWTGAAGTPVFEAPYDKQVWIYGSLTLIPDMEWAVQGEVHFRAFEGGKTITSAGKVFLYHAFFDGTGGEWTLLDAFSAYQLQHIDGALYTNGQSLTVDYYFSSYGSPNRALYFGSSNMHMGQGSSCTFFEIGSDPFNFDAGTSTIYMNGHPNCSYFYGGNKAYYNLVCEAPTRIEHNNSFHAATFLKSAKIFGSNVFQSLTLSPGATYELASFSTQTITPLGDFIAQGYGGFPIEIRSSNLGQEATLHKDGDPICLDFLYLTDIAATGTAFQYAGANSDDVFGNSGWLFESCPECFSTTPAPAPVLDPASVVNVPAGQQATLILQGLPAGYEAVWYNADQTMELYTGVANYFQPVVEESSVFFGALRELATGCVSDLLMVQIDRAFTLAKTASSIDAAGNGEIDNAGEVIGYTIVLSNTGNQSLSNVAASDQYHQRGDE